MSSATGRWTVLWVACFVVTPCPARLRVREAQDMAQDMAQDVAQDLAQVPAASFPPPASPPSPSAQARLSIVDWNAYDEREQDGPGTYSFGYEIEDPASGNTQFRQEERFANGTVSGTYGLVEPDGNVRIVSYVADAMGYRARIDNSLRKNENYPPTTPSPPPPKPPRRPQTWPARDRLLQGSATPVAADGATRPLEWALASLQAGRRPPVQDQRLRPASAPANSSSRRRAPSSTAKPRQREETEPGTSVPRQREETELATSAPSQRQISAQQEMGRRFRLQQQQQRQLMQQQQNQLTQQQQNNLMQQQQNQLTQQQQNQLMQQQQNQLIQQQQKQLMQKQQQERELLQQLQRNSLGAEYAPNSFQYSLPATGFGNNAGQVDDALALNDLVDDGSFYGSDSGLAARRRHSATDWSAKPIVVWPAPSQRPRHELPPNPLLDKLIYQQNK